MSSDPVITAFHEPVTGSLTYIVADPATKQAAIIDPVLNYDGNSGHTKTTSIDEVLAEVQRQGLMVQWILETHVHADHLTAAAYVKSKGQAKLAIGGEVQVVQKLFGALFNIADSIAPNAADFDATFKDGESFKIGELTAKVLHTPGHTPACISYVIGNAVFVGDALFMPDYGTARCDFPGGDAATLYNSIHKILSLPETTRVCVGHDYGPNGRDIKWEATVAEHLASNVHIGGSVSQDKFVAMRVARDKTLALPNLIIPSVQVNIRGGRLPEPEGNGTRYLKIPLDKF
jgi:glyoxylase-like metal-dependent hydrolase (beta-lactamase superfamily II)